MWPPEDVPVFDPRIRRAENRMESGDASTDESEWQPLPIIPSICLYQVNREFNQCTLAFQSNVCLLSPERFHFLEIDM